MVIWYVRQSILIKGSSGNELFDDASRSMLQKLLDDRTPLPRAPERSGRDVPRARGSNIASQRCLARRYAIQMKLMTRLKRFVLPLALTRAPARSSRLTVPARRAIGLPGAPAGSAQPLPQAIEHRQRHDRDRRPVAARVRCFKIAVPPLAGDGDDSTKQQVVDDGDAGFHALEHVSGARSEELHREPRRRKARTASSHRLVAQHRRRRESSRATSRRAAGEQRPRRAPPLRRLARLRTRS